MYARCGELAALGGRFLYVLIVTPALALIAAEQQVVELHKSAWFWLFLMAAIFAGFFFFVAYRALVERDQAIGGMPLNRLPPHAPLEPGHQETGHEWEDEPGHRRWKREVMPAEEREATTSGELKRLPDKRPEGPQETPDAK